MTMLWSQGAAWPVRFPARYLTGYRRYTCWQCGAGSTHVLVRKVGRKRRMYCLVCFAGGVKEGARK